MKARPSSPLLPLRGSALVIILAFVVLATVLVLAFFSRSILERQMSNASANQTKVDILAHSAVDTIVGDFRQEIAAGSTSTNVGPATNQTTLYFPTSPTNMIPARSGNPTFSGSPTNDPIPNLIRRSVRSDPLVASGYIGVAASAVGSTNLSANGRSVSPARWNAHYLIPRQNAGSTTNDTTPTNSFVAPDWVMVTSNGPATITAPSPSVIGRYAYAVYDEGGLLDANVAGFPSGLTNYPNTATNVVSFKGSAALADLSVIGITNADNLIGWRNYGTIKPSSGSLGSFDFQANASVSSNYYQYLTNATNSGGVTVSTNSFNGRTDQMFTSRQALLKFRRATGISQDALQYLGTFSRDLEQPSFQPDSARPKNTKYTVMVDGGNDGYSSDGTLQDKINPSLLAVRDSSGNAVVKRRFPLSRLALLRPNPSAADAVKIKDYFGLTWDSTKNRWIYDHGGAPEQIFSLADIPGGREPDFFELLRACINCDSLGKQHAGLDNNSKTISGADLVYSPHQFNTSTSPAPAAIDSFVNYQVFQIGANIIDQYDSDSLPTVIYGNNSATGREFYGIENLPYLAGWAQMWYRMKALQMGTDINSAVPTPPASGTTYETWVMIQPIIWNPHAPDANPNPPDLPTNFQVVASAMTDVAITLHPQVTAAWWTGTVTSLQSTYPAAPGYVGMTGTSTLRAFVEATIDPSKSILTFSTSTGDAAFREPYRLRAPDYPAGSGASNGSGYPEGKIVVAADPGLIAADGGNSAAIGFFCGKAWTGPAVVTGGASTTNKWLSAGNLNRDLKLKLQYKTASGNWQTYDVIEQVYNASGNYSTVDNLDSGDNIRGFRTSVRGDPRSDRWGLFQFNNFPSMSQSAVPNGLTLFNDNGVDNGSNKTPLYYLPQGITWKPSSASTYLMTGNNTGGAAAEGWTSGNWNVGDLMVNLQNSTENPNVNKSTSIPGAKTYYTDADGVIRRASGGYYSGNDGLPFYTGNTNSRPVILNRPFRSVAEMGYAFRGQAWKDVDFFMPESGDAALLDAFCLNELASAPSDVTVAGRVNLNTRQASVLQALISGVSKAEGGTLTANEAKNAAQALVNWTSDTSSSTNSILTKGPLRNRSELVGKFVSQISVTPKPGLSGAQNPILEPIKSYSGLSSTLTSDAGGVFSASGDASIKRRRESVMRALADAGNTRTWNLFIDLVAQVGRYPAQATALSSFMVEGETRVWVHLAIDRITGKVVARQVEVVSE